MRSSLALACILAVACGNRDVPEAPRHVEPTTPAPPSASPTAPPPTIAPPTTSRRPTARVIRTEPLFRSGEAPSTTLIRVEDLPRPSTERVRNPPEVVPPPDDPVLRVPEGFEVNVFADGLDAPRWLRITPDGDVLVTETRENRIRLLADRDGDGAAEVLETFADDDAGQRLDIPFGMTFAGGSFYVGNHDEVRRWPWRSGQRRLEGEGERITELPGGGYNQHWTRNVLASPDGTRLYVTIGSATNDDPEPSPRATVQVMGLDGSGRRTFASGVRNPVGLAFHPGSGVLWATVVERDGLGDELVPDYLTGLREGGFYGWPWVYLAPNLRNPHVRARGPAEAIAATITPDVLFQAHSTPLGVAFYDGETFPAPYRGGAFVACRGSWNSRRGAGYGIAYVPFDAAGRPTGGYQDFLTGFLLDPEVPRVWGRPVGMVVAPDGSLLFTEESNGRIYRVQVRSDRG